MRTASRRVPRAVFGAAVLAALGFGTAQAFAAPGAPARNHTCAIDCNDYCIGTGYNGGSCVGSPGKCLCY